MRIRCTLFILPETFKPIIGLFVVMEEKGKLKRGFLVKSAFIKAESFFKFFNAFLNLI